MGNIRFGLHRKYPPFLICFLWVIVSFYFLVAVFEPFFLMHDPNAVDYTMKFAQPSIQYPFGCDQLGRCVYSRIIQGARISIGYAALVVFISCIWGTSLGIISSYYGGKVDMIMMRIVDIISTIPLTLYVILIMQVLGAGIQSIIVALGSVYWVDMARVVRGQILSLKQQEFVLAAKTIGSSATTILFDHLIPNALGSILVTITMLIPSAIFMEAFLGYLGIGLQPPLASLGTMCNDASANLRTSPHELLIPALMICVIMFAFNFVGDGLRDALDPKLKK